MMNVFDKRSLKMSVSTKVKVFFFLYGFYLHSVSVYDEHVVADDYDDDDKRF